MVGLVAQKFMSPCRYYNHRTANAPNYFISLGGEEDGLGVFEIIPAPPTVNKAIF